eukprot:358524-Chlamydomonas_euryale.AAC.6
MEQLPGWQQPHNRQQHHGTAAWLAAAAVHHGTAAWLASTQQAARQSQFCMASKSNCTTGSNTKSMLYSWQQQHTRQHHGRGVWLAAAQQAGSIAQIMLHAFQQHDSQ